MGQWRRNMAMSAKTRKRAISKAVIFACLAAASGASYALGLPSGFRGGRTGSEGPGVVTVDQKLAFLAYVKRQQMRSALVLKRVSVGDVLPDSGVSYSQI